MGQGGRWGAVHRRVEAVLNQRPALGVPLHAGAARLDATAVLEHRHLLLPPINIEAERVVAPLDGHLDVPEPHRAVLARRAHGGAVGRVPCGGRARGDVALGRAHVANIHVALHERRQLASVAIEDDGLVGGARHDEAVAGGLCTRGRHGSAAGGQGPRGRGGDKPSSAEGRLNTRQPSRGAVANGVPSTRWSGAGRSLMAPRGGGRA